MTDADKKRVEISDAEYIRQWKIDIPFVLEANRHNERVDRIAASHAEAVALLGEAKTILAHIQLSTVLDDQLAVAVDDILPRLAKVNA